MGNSEKITNFGTLKLEGRLYSRLMTVARAERKAGQKTSAKASSIVASALRDALSDERVLASMALDSGIDDDGEE